MKHNIFIVDDDDIFRQTICNTLENCDELDLNVLQAKFPKTALASISEHSNIECILLDYNFEKWGGRGQMNGLELAEEIKKIASHIPIILMSETNQRGQVGMLAGKQHIHSFLDKPFGKDKVVAELMKIINPAKSKVKNFHYKDAQEILNLHGFLSKSESMQKVCFDALLSSNSEKNVLIIGESGTGKTYLAEVMHKLSNRKNKDFFDINVASLQESLIESELFGHVKGAFTGADKDKVGIFELVSDGTILIDEIADIPLHVQAKLLYVLGEQKRFSPVGNPNRQIPVNARIIAATKYSIEEAKEKNKLRDDLIGRFSQIIRIPPLRNRTEDIELHINQVIENYKPKIIRIDSAAQELILRQPWVGNVRQLRNFIELCIAYCEAFKSETISIDIVKLRLAEEYGISYTSNRISLEGQVRKTISLVLEDLENLVCEKTQLKGKGGIKETMKIFEKELFMQLLEMYKNNHSAAANYIYENKDTFRYRLSTLNDE